LKNSAYAVSENTKPKIKLTCSNLHDRSLIIIEDNGCGIPFNMLDYVFMPFFTTRKDGSGIGLTLSRQIMKAHDGFINLVSHEGVGTKITLIF
jgi:C4-dicarboxylate-specific signal transduction histidine kinase